MGPKVSKTILAAILDREKIQHNLIFEGAKVAIAPHFLQFFAVQNDNF
jgi:hypothetical protein